MRLACEREEKVVAEYEMREERDAEMKYVAERDE